MRARNITDRICRDFCQWLRGLGGADSTIDEEVLRDMFEIDFTAEASRTMQVRGRWVGRIVDGEGKQSAWTRGVSTRIALHVIRFRARCSAAAS